jgi:uncharacterized protein YjeT (DUF2065 family)
VLRKLFIIAMFVLLALFTGVVYLAWPTTVSREKADRMLAAIVAEPDLELRATGVRALLVYMNHTDSSAEDAVVSAMLEKLKQHYVLTRDEALLLALEQSDFDGYYSKYVWAMVSQIEHLPEFERRYKEHPQQAAYLARLRAS